MDSIEDRAEHAEHLANTLFTEERITTIYRVENEETADPDGAVVEKLRAENVLKRVDGEFELTDKGKLLYPAVVQLLEKQFLVKLDWLINRTD